MEQEELKLLLRSGESRNILRALAQIRSSDIKTPAGLQTLLEENFVAELVPLLERSNHKIIDLSLSILGNLLQGELAQEQTRQAGGLGKLVNIVENIEDRNIVMRGWRCLANAAQHRDNLSLLRSGYNLSASLGKLMAASSPGDQIMLVLVRTVRIICRPEVLLLEPAVTDLLVSSLQAGSEPGLVRAVTKCVARLSQAASPLQAQPLLAAAPALVSLARTSDTRPEVADNSLGSLVNLSQLEQLRPGLGTAGTVELLVEKWRTGRSGVAADSLVRTLCLYCRESVNRVRMREGGGCTVLVSVLASASTETVIRDTVLRSLLQFLYDNHSLNVLMSEGLIPCLVRLLQQVMEEADMKHTSQTSCLSSPDTEGTAPSPVEARDLGVEETERRPEENVEAESSPGPEDLNLSEPEETEEPRTEDVDVSPAVEKPAGAKLARTEEKVKPETKTGPVFRITSPSYQAVQYELEQFLQLKSSYSGLDPGPGSPSSSLCQSPDRSPPHIPCSFSPASSPGRLYSPVRSPLHRSLSPVRPHYSPLYSPSGRADSPDPSYSPVETFSEEETEDSPAPGEETNKQPVETPERDQATPQPSSSTEDVSSLEPWRTRSLRIQRTTTYLGQTFVLPPRDKSPEVAAAAKRPRLSLSSPPYKYVSSLAVSPRTSLGGVGGRPRQLSRSDSSPAVESSDRLAWILQILSRLSQADRPHSDLTSRATLDVLFLFLSRLPPSQVAASKAAKILIRKVLTTNLHCLFPFLLGRHLSRVLLQFSQLDRSCDCGQSALAALLTSLQQNLTLLAETGYGEGEICHRLVHPAIGQREKQNIVISASLLVRQRKMLNNILVCHGTLDLLLDTLEDGGEEEEDGGGRVSHCVHSLSHLAAHLGVRVCCSSSLDPGDLQGETLTCSYEVSQLEQDLTLVCDDGTRVKVNKEVISDSCPVFSAMLTGSFTEAERETIRLPGTSGPALSCLLHFLYGCQPDLCPQFRRSSGQPDTLLELVSLSDKYLLSQLNLSVCHSIIRHSGSPQHVTQIYRAALQNNYPVLCAGREASLALSIVSFILVGGIETEVRVQLVRNIVSSDLSQHLLDDIGKILRSRLQPANIKK